MTKEKFCEIIDEIKRLHEYESELYAVNRKYNYDADISFPTLEGTVISLLEEIFNCPETEVGTDISYFVYELDFGKDWEPGMITDKDGNDVDHSTAEKLYDWLIKEYDKKE